MPETEPKAEPTIGPLICGTASYVDGTFVWTDYAYDDTGASERELGGGAATYPEPGANAADLIQLHLALDGDALTVRAVLQTLTDPDVPVLVVGFDTDCCTDTGASTLPGGVWRADPPLGVEYALVVSAEGATLVRDDNGSWVNVAAVDCAIDTAAQTVTASVPRALLDPGDGQWRVFAAVGIRHDGRSFLDGDGHGAIYDLAFVSDPSPARPRGASNAWQDREQADVLAGRLSSERAAATVDFGKLARRERAVADARTPGTHTFLYRSALELGGGVQPWPREHHPELWTRFGMPAPPAAPWTMFAGRYQPYGVWLPERLPEPAPLVVFLHGTGSNHLSNASRSFFGPGRFDIPAIVVEPLGRGGSCGYYGAAEQDVLDVMADIATRFAIDEDRVVLTGISQGGFGTFRLGELYPDRFSALVPLVGQSALVPEIEMMISGGEPFMPDALENLCNVPIRMVNGRLDPQKNAFAGNVPDLDALALQKLEYDFRYWQLLRRGHEVIPELTNGVFLDVLQMPRDPNPARVVLSVEPFLDVDDLVSGLRLRHNCAYWVSNVTVRGSGFARGDKGTVDVTTRARPDRVRVAHPYAIVSGNTRESRDLMGPNPNASGFDEWVEQGIRLEPGPPQPVENAFDATFTRVGAVTLDVARMGLDVDRELTATIVGDGATDVSLAGPWRGRIDVRIGATCRSHDPVGGVVTVSHDFDAQPAHVTVSPMPA
jgi:pimeloyl-ACP methyl ester carboxylesterase